MKSNSGYRQAPYFLLAGVLSLLALQMVLPAGNARQALLFVVLWIAPALLWARCLGGDLLERLLGGVALALLVAMVLTLAATYVPGPLPPWSLFLLAFVAMLLPLLAARLLPLTYRREADESGWTGRELAAFVLILLLAAVLRLTNLDYKEFQGDEGVIMVRAAQSLLGDELALMRHQKGPVEILLPLLPWGLGNSINELWARAVFTWAGWLVVPAIGALGKRWFGARTGLLAALLFASGGFSVAFARIVQYQSLVMLWGVLSVLFAHRYWRSGSRRDLLLSAALLAGGLLAHYDAILTAPAVAWLVLARWRQLRRQLLRHAAIPALVGAALLALFYVPYMANPTFAQTGSYLLQDRVGGALFSWSIPEVWRMATFYNSTYYVVLLLISAFMGLLDVASRRSHMAAILFLLTPLLFYTLVVADPRTHVYTVFPGLSLLAAHGAVFFWRVGEPGIFRQAGLALFALLLGASLLYVVLLFVDVTPERQRTWEQNRPRYFPTTWSQPPQFGLFGFPHQVGWRLAPSLVSQFPYGSNEEPEITGWYMAQAPRTHCPDFRSFLVAANAQDALPYDAQRVQQKALHTVVTVNGVPSLHIYADSAGPTVQLEATERVLWRTPQQVNPSMRTGNVPVDVELGSQIRLLGYTLQPGGVLRPGETLNVVLYWQALGPIERNYQVFVHLYDRGGMWGQHDGAPDCAIRPTSGWEPGQIIRDAHQITLSQETPPGEYPLSVGMYDLLTAERLPLAATGDDQIQLTQVQVRRD